MYIFTYQQTLQCSNCNITYYGETDRHLKVRAGEYISTSPLTEKRDNNNKKSSDKDHCLFSGHVCSFDDITVLNYESHKFKRLIKESLLVTKDKPLLKKQIKSLKLDLSSQSHLGYFIIPQMICSYLIDIFVKNVNIIL